MSDPPKDSRQPFHETIITELQDARENRDFNLIGKLIGMAVGTKIPTKHQEAVFEEIEASLRWMREFVNGVNVTVLEALEFYRELPAEEATDSDKEPESGEEVKCSGRPPPSAGSE